MGTFDFAKKDGQTLDSVRSSRGAWKKRLQIFL